jgi:predicted Zn-dependent protease
MAMMQRADAAGPLSDWMLRHWAQLARAAGEQAVALACLERLLRQNPDEPLAREWLAQ